MRRPLSSSSLHREKKKERKVRHNRSSSFPPLSPILQQQHQSSFDRKSCSSSSTSSTLLLLYHNNNDDTTTDANSSKEVTKWKNMHSWGKQVLRCCGLFMTPCLIYGFISLMGRYNHHNSSRTPLHETTATTNNNIPEMILSFSSDPNVVAATDVCSSNNNDNNHHRFNNNNNKNAIVYLIRSDDNNNKESSSSSSDHFDDNFLKSMDNLYENYLKEQQQRSSSASGIIITADTHIFLFHTGQLGIEDLQMLESRYDHNNNDMASLPKGMIRLVNLQNTPYWGRLPDTVRADDPTKWKDYNINNMINDRHEYRFWSIQIWEYFDQLNHLQQSCNYRYILRMDSRSYLYSPINYDIFEFVQNNNYQYSFRFCSPITTNDLLQNKEVWDEFSELDTNNHNNKSEEDDDNSNNESCIFYNPFFLADLQFFRSRPVQRWLQFVDAGGYNYRNNLSPSFVHSMALTAFASSETIHRFLDFTLEHFPKKSTNNNNNNNNGCIHDQGVAFQGGYNDKDAKLHIEEWMYLQEGQKKRKEENNNCPVWIIHNLRVSELTPQYTHYLPRKKNVAAEYAISLPTIMIS